MYLLGYDIGSSSVKASLVNVETGKCAASAFFPKTEAPILAVKQGWAEQDPQSWWENLKLSTQAVLSTSGAKPEEIKAIGISYQMHGLVCVDKNQQVLRPSIIWCDSRAVPYGQKAFQELGEAQCLSHLLNSPGNFTASKLAWVKENEPGIYAKIYKVMLPGDYIAMRLTGEICTTVSGLSEGMFWDFKENKVADFLLNYYGIDASLLADIRPTFSEQGKLTEKVAAELGLKAGTPVTYRAGDQPNNALSLNVFNPGEIASTAGTSGVVYGVNGSVNYDPQSRVNTFAHVNHTASQTRLGVLLCINGTGILNSWMKRTLASDLNYAEMNEVAAQAPIGADGISILPFGNGAERMLQNQETGCSIQGINFNLHNRSHLLPVNLHQHGKVLRLVCRHQPVQKQQAVPLGQTGFLQHLAAGFQRIAVALSQQPIDIHGENHILERPFHLLHAQGVGKRLAVLQQIGKLTALRRIRHCLVQEPHFRRVNGTVLQRY